MFRWSALAVLLSCFGISAYFRHRARQEGGTIPRRAEKPLLQVGRAIVAFPILGAILAYIVNPEWMTWASLSLPAVLRWVGVALGVLTVPAVYWVFRSIGKNISETVLTKAHHELVKHGPYRWVRHPLYTSGFTLILSIGLMAANWFLLLFAFITLVAIVLIVIPREEQALISAFGDEYRDYIRSTSRLFPTVPKRP